MQNTCTRQVSDLVARGQKVWVKIVGIAKAKLSLSMREVAAGAFGSLFFRNSRYVDPPGLARPVVEVDQETGEDTRKKRTGASSADALKAKAKQGSARGR